MLADLTVALSPVLGAVVQQNVDGFEREWGKKIRTFRGPKLRLMGKEGKEVNLFCLQIAKIRGDREEAH